MTVPDRLARTALIAATTLGAAFVVLASGGSGSLDRWPIRVIYLLMVSVTVIPWLAVAVVRPGWRPASRLAPALAICLAVFAISTLTSRVPRLSLEMLGYAFLLTMVYLLLVTLMRRPVLRLHFERLALVMCVVVAIAYLAQVFQFWLVWWDLVGHLTLPPLRPGYVGLFLSPNPIATVVLMFGAFGLGARGVTGRTGWAVAGVVATLFLAATFITGSRGAWLGAGLGAIAVLVAAMLSPEIRSRAAARLRSRTAIGVLAVAIPLVVAAGVLTALTGRLNVDDGGSRAGFARASAQMLESSPLTGVGPGTWGVLRAANTIPTDLDYYIPHAHSMYVQTVTEFGLAGLIAAAAMVVALGLLIARSVRSEDSSRRRVGYAALFAVVLLAGQQYADLLMNVPAVLLAVALPIAWLDAMAQPPTNGHAPKRAKQAWLGQAVPFGAAVVTVVIVVGLARIETIAGVANQAVHAANERSWPEATRLAEEAVAGDPDVNLYRFQLGVSAANAGELPLAERSLEAIAAADDYTYAWLDLAAVRWELGDEAGARDALTRAERLGLQRTTLAVAAGWLRQQLGDEDAANSNYATAIAQMPTLVGDPFWDSPTGPRGGLATIIEAVEQRVGPTTRLQIHLIQGEFELATEQVASLASSDPDLYPLLVPAWQGDPGAIATLQAEASSRPLDPTPATWCRLVATYQGDLVLASRYGVWLALMTSVDAGLPPVARLSFESDERPPVYFLEGYGTVYRRTIPDAQVVNLLPRLVLQELP